MIGVLRRRKRSDKRNERERKQRHVEVFKKAKQQQLVLN